MEASPEAAAGPNWCSLPAGVLQHIFCRASAWQIPGTCLAAPVCRTWREAAAGCRGIRLLYHALNPTANTSFATWLKLCSPQLGSLILSSGQGTDVNSILGPLAKAATAAAAAGAPLPLHTLRVLGDGPNPPLASTLVRELRNLRTLQWTLRGPEDPARAGAQFRKHLGPMRQATQLQELYLDGPFACDYGNRNNTPASAAWLPANLSRLSWSAPEHYAWNAHGGAPALQHLHRMSFLRLSNWGYAGLSSKLPPGLQELELGDRYVPLEELGLQRVLTHLALCPTTAQLEGLSSFSSVRSITIAGQSVDKTPSIHEWVTQLTALTALHVVSYGLESTATEPTMGAMSATAASVPSLRHLGLRFFGRGWQPTGLAALTQLTRLEFGDNGAAAADAAQRVSWVQALEQLQGLRWLTVAGVMVEAVWGWVGSLQQLRVLVVREWRGMRRGAAGVSSWPWLGACNPRSLPPRLLLLGVSCWYSEEEVGVRVRRLLRGTECEVVVGADLDEVADPTKQLAGMPEWLQQALA